MRNCVLLLAALLAAAACESTPDCGDGGGIAGADSPCMTQHAAFAALEGTVRDNFAAPLAEARVIVECTDGALRSIPRISPTGANGRFSTWIDFRDDGPVQWPADSMLQLHCQLTGTLHGVPATIIPDMVTLTVRPREKLVTAGTLDVRMRFATESAPFLTLNMDHIHIGLGRTHQLVPTMSGASLEATTYRSSNDAIARVNAQGLITGAGMGSAIVVAENSVVAARPDSVIVTVVVQTTPPSLPIAITPASASIQVGDSVQFRAISGAADVFTWESSNPAIATITTTGLAHGVSAGTVVITAIATNDPTKRITASLSVTPR